MDNDKVGFIWKDRAEDNKTKLMALDAEEFIRRFLLHALPKGFRKIRYFGFLSPIYVKAIFLDLAPIFSI